MKGDNFLFKNGKTMILAYDQGFEHGPIDFNIDNADPAYVFGLAQNGVFSAFAVQAGLAHHYRKDFSSVPLIVKLNGKTRYENNDPVSFQHTSVAYAKKIGAKAVGYTLYLGSSKEQEMLVEFGRICEEAHKLGLLSICWMYPRGPMVHDELSTETLAYGARVAMELGADVIKIKYNNDPEGLKWVVKCAGKAKIVIAGGSKSGDEAFLKMAAACINAGAAGLAVGRNIWQSNKPLIVSRALRKIIFEGASPEDAYRTAVEEDSGNKVK